MTGFDYFIITVLVIMWSIMVISWVSNYKYIEAGFATPKIKEPLLITLVGVGTILYRTMG